MLITNNHGLCQSVLKGRFVNGSPLDVLVAARNFIQLGSLLLSNPLCGGLKPWQQPFRSVLIQERPGDRVAQESLVRIEAAIAVYRACEDRLILPGDLTSDARTDYAFVDAELMRGTLAQYSQLREEPGLINPETPSPSV